MKKANASVYLAWFVSLSTFYLSADSPALASQPVKFKKLNHLVIVPVVVNGTGPFDFIFDTGASFTVIDQELARQLKLVPIENIPLITAAGSKDVTCHLLDSVAVGPKSVENLMVLSTGMPEIRSINSRIRGVLGQNFLSGYNYILNYRDRRIEFEEENEFEKQMIGTRLSVKRERGRMLVEAKPSSSSKASAWLVIDSGAVNIVAFRNLHESGFDIEIDFKGMKGLVTLSSIVGSHVIRMGSIRKLQIGEEEFVDTPVRIDQSHKSMKDRPESGILPASLFRVIYFNSRENFVILNPRFTR